MLLLKQASSASVETLYPGLCSLLNEAHAGAWAEILPGQLADALDTSKHGELSSWFELLGRIQQVSPQFICLSTKVVQIGRGDEIDGVGRELLQRQLQSLHPWRKGPYRLFGITIDTEWRSDLKWSRLKDHISPLKQRLVLDVGCGNGYHCWRMLGAGAKTVIGIDPLVLNVMQFLFIKKLLGAAPVHVLPLAMEDVPSGLKVFDTVFSMGVLYHRRSPLDHLLELKSSLRPGGELVLETLVVDGDASTALLPVGRYAKMRNVWFLPSSDALAGWLRRIGFRKVRLIDITATTSYEQRSTPWMRFQSLADFLDGDSPERTCEGLPAPKRAILIANNP